MISDTVVVAIVAAAAPVITTLLTWKQQKRSIKDVHELSNNRLTEALSAIDALKQEVNRLNKGGEPTPTVTQPVTRVEGTVSVENSR